MRCRDGQVVAVPAVWSAGGGRPGLIERLAVHQEHRSRGYGTVMTNATHLACLRISASE
ncbi:GNAT family N-acetyltransferase [Arthrobacter sp. zg-Y238]|uniref:GNAT family N-acetyltransferase n=1 Tax=Arthrobacter sp. zg-Y238 TaxID=2964614 RepID=UPI00351D3786